MLLMLENFSQQLITLTQSVGSDKFYTNIKLLFSTLVDFDELAVFNLSKSDDVQLLYRYGNDGVENRLQGEDSWKYLTRLYVLDPFYRLFADTDQYGFFSLEDIAPDEFTKTYGAYFNFLTLSDEIGFLFPIDSTHCLHIDISRFGKNKAFSIHDMQQCAAMYNPISCLIALHLKLEKKVISRTRSNVESVLANFGKTLLTKKEYQVCQLLLQGHSTKAITHIMKIGYETVKMHKKNIYGKGFLSSQSELMALFIDTLQQENLDIDIDHFAMHAK
ncbi:MAG: helix-turn-helix transcriptional regulator [Colwellia sp.]|nr:helix-turn-helix transcriptional regulator [Colwellia sp.]